MLVCIKCKHHFTQVMRCVTTCKIETELIVGCCFPLRLIDCHYLFQYYFWYSYYIYHRRTLKKNSQNRYEYHNRQTNAFFLSVSLCFIFILWQQNIYCFWFFAWLVLSYMFVHASECWQCPLCWNWCIAVDIICVIIIQEELISFPNYTSNQEVCAKGHDLQNQLSGFRLDGKVLTFVSCVKRNRVS